MSTISDVQALYGSVRLTWEKSRAHVIAHLILAGVIFVICGATIPPVSVTRLDPKQVADNEWFRLAKDTGIVYMSFVIPVVAVAAYAALLRAGGQLLVTILMLIWPASSRANPYRLVFPSTLEPLALTVGKSDFELDDLLTKSAEFVVKYQSKKNDQWSAFQKTLNEVTKNAQIYLGDFLIFLLSWILLFKLMPPQALWIQANEARFWPVALIMSSLALFAWFRVLRAMAALPSLQLLYVTAILDTDPDIRAQLEVIPAETRKAVKERVEELWLNERENTPSRPSLLGFIRYRLGLQRKDKYYEVGQPFSTLYKQGERFLSDKEWHRDYDRHWFAGYLAYLYYQFHLWLSQAKRALWVLIRYIVTGAP